MLTRPGKHLLLSHWVVCSTYAHLPELLLGAFVGRIAAQVGSD